MKTLKESLFLRWITFWVLSPFFMMAIANMSEVVSGKSNIFSIHDPSKMAKYFVIALIFTLPLFLTGFTTTVYIEKFKKISLIKRAIYLLATICLLLISFVWMSILLVDTPN